MYLSKRLPVELQHIPKLLYFTAYYSMPIDNDSTYAGKGPIANGKMAIYSTPEPPRVRILVTPQVAVKH